MKTRKTAGKMEREGVNQELHSGRHQIDSSLVPPGGLRRRNSLTYCHPGWHWWVLQETKVNVWNFI